MRGIRGNHKSIADDYLLSGAILSAILLGFGRSGKQYPVICPLISSIWRFLNWYFEFASDSPVNPPNRLYPLWNYEYTQAGNRAAPASFSNGKRLAC
jgi:hypothetical protein